MLFSSIVFLYYFLPITLVLYFLCPHRHRNYILFFSSLVFYGWGEPVYLFLMLATIGITYVFSLFIEKYRHRPQSRFFFILSLTLCLGILGIFKYANFFLETFHIITDLPIPLLSIALPIGISFYTFQAISYLVDVYRGQIEAQKNPLIIATYITMFPQLIAGPIVRYTDIKPQLLAQSSPTSKEAGFVNHDTFYALRLSQVALGIRYFIIGLSKKLLLANSLGEISSCFISSSDLSVLYGWIYVVSVSLQIYFDFSGYSDMAIGLGKILGFEFPKNFDYPFISKSITEFWRRWHITLGCWFRDYLYIPLGGNRVSFGRHIFNILLVWCATGLWHGADFNFILWGLYFGIFLILEKYLWATPLSRHPLVAHIYLLFFCGISFVIFQGTDASSIFRQICLLFGIGNSPLISQEACFILSNYGVILLLSVIAATPLFANLYKQLRINASTQKIVLIFEPVYLLFLLFICTTCLINGSYNPFLYFRF